ncbi:hypothetical protein SKAU_G00030620 [Synaphobranchus kaupii]|uniref:Otopetrin 1 n=1 Tax=Synaphobranchus kaupii TaxID=118154 RepID=A0A9Q1GEZ4_SYNKA|nr:hypothetical protein SKAU_G00030620 [Synaphobranchus kaupii]
MKGLDSTDLSAMVEHGGLDILCLNKHRHSSSSSFTPEKGKKKFNKLRVSLTEDYPKKNAEILSAQYGTNLLLFGAALMLAVSYHDHVVREAHLLWFITTIMIVQLLWMLWYSARRDRQKTILSEKDAHAGTRWLRGGITVLALLSLIMDAFLIGRFGVIHAVFTNLLLWCNGIMSETEHFMNAHKKRLSAQDIMNHTEVENVSHCNCSTSSCSVFSNSLYYLYPFNIEYHILVSAMLFVMWKNIGRTINHQHNRKRPVTRSTGLFLGPVLGLVALAGTITVLVVYTVKLKNPAESHGVSENIMFYCHGIVILACMCTAGTLGLVVYRLDSRALDASKNPSRQLDTELLCGSSVGSWLMSWCTMVAVVARGAPGYSWTNFLYALLLVLEKYIQNLFIIESLYREQEPEPPSTPEVFIVTTPRPRPPLQRHRQPGLREPGRRLRERAGAQLHSGTAEFIALLTRQQGGDSEQEKADSEEHRRLPLHLWLLPAFGCRPQYDNRLEQETFGFAIWTTVLNFAMPLNLFYRMHSVANLFEVFRKV